MGGLAGWWGVGHARRRALYLYSTTPLFIYFPASISLLSLPFDGSAFLITCISLFSCLIKGWRLGGRRRRGTCVDHTPAGWKTEAPPYASLHTSLRLSSNPSCFVSPSASQHACIHPAARGSSQSSTLALSSLCLDSSSSFYPPHHHPLTLPPSLFLCWLHNPHHHLLNSVCSRTRHTQKITLNQ